MKPNDISKNISKNPQFQWIVNNRIIIILVALLLTICYVSVNMSKFDGTASHKVPDQKLREGYWEGLQHYYIQLGTAGEYQGKAIRSKPGESGNLIEGPFITLPKGSYQVKYEYTILEGNQRDFSFILRLTSDKGNAVLAEKLCEYKDEDIGKKTEVLDVTLDSIAEHVEMQVVVNSEAHILLTKTEVVKL